MFDTLEGLRGISPLQWVGVSGFVCYMSAFGLVQLGHLDGNSAAYSAANVIAATLVAISLAEAFNLASALIQGSWIIIGLTGLALRIRKTLAATRTVLSTTLKTEVQ